MAFSAPLDEIQDAPTGFRAPDSDLVDNGFSAPKEDLEAHSQVLAGDKNYDPVSDAAQYAAESPGWENAYSAYQARKNIPVASRVASAATNVDNYKELPSGMGKFIAGAFGTAPHSLAQGALTAAAPIAGWFGRPDLESKFRNEAQSEGAEAVLAEQKVGQTMDGYGRNIMSWVPNVGGSAVGDSMDNIESQSVAESMTPEEQSAHQEAMKRLNFSDRVQAYRDSQQLAQNRPLDTGIVADISRAATGYDPSEVFGPENLKAIGARPASSFVSDSMAATGDPTNLIIPLAGEIPGVKTLAGGIVQGGGKLLQIPEAIMGSVPKLAKIAKVGEGTATTATLGGLGYSAIAHPAATATAAGAYALGKVLGFAGRALDEQGGALRMGIPSALDQTAQSALSAGQSAIGTNLQRGIGNAAGNIVATSLGFAPINYALSGGDANQFVQSEVGASAMGGVFGLGGERARMEDIANYRLAQYGSQQFTDTPMWQAHQAQMSKFSPEDQQQINALRGTLYGGTGTDVLVLDGQNFARQVGDIGGNARGQFAPSPDGKTIFVNADAVGSTPAQKAGASLDTAGHETGHAVVDFLKNAGREADAQNLFSSIAGALTPEQTQALTDSYHSRLLASTDLTGKTPEQIEAIRQKVISDNPPEKILEENLAEITRKILNGRPISTFAIPQSTLDKVTDAASRWMEARGWSPAVDPDASLGFKAQMVKEAARKMQDVLYETGKRASAAAGAGETEGQRLIKARNDLANIQPITPDMPSARAAAIRRQKAAAQAVIDEIQGKQSQPAPVGTTPERVINNTPPPTAAPSAPVAPIPTSTEAPVAPAAPAKPKFGDVPLEPILKPKEATPKPAPQAEPSLQPESPLSDEAENMLKIATAEGAKISVGLIQRKLNLGYTKAFGVHAELLDAGHIDKYGNLLKPKEKTPAPEPASQPNANRPPPTPQPVAAAEDQNTAADVKQGMSGMAKGVTASLYDSLLAKLKAGDLTEAGQPSRVLQQAKPAFDAGIIKNADDLKSWISGDPEMRAKLSNARSIPTSQESEPLPPSDGGSREGNGGNTTTVKPVEAPSKDVEGTTPEETPVVHTKEDLDAIAAKARTDFLADKEFAKAGKNKGKHTAKNQELADKAAFDAAAEAHAETVPANYGGMKQRVDAFGKKSVSGNLDPSRPFDSWLIDQAQRAGNLPEGALDTMLKLQDAVGKTVTFDYGHAPVSEEGEQPTQESRAAQQAKHSVKARLAGESPTQTEAKTSIPLGIQFNSGNKSFNVFAASPEKLLNNFNHLAETMQHVGQNVPYKSINDPQFVADFKGVIRNHQNGWFGDGSRPAVGTAEYPNTANPEWANSPQRAQIPEDRFDFINMMLGDEGAKAATPQAKAKAHLANENRTLVNEAGETNETRQAINDAVGPVQDKNGNPSTWSKVTLEDPLNENLSPALASNVRPSEQTDESIRQHGKVGDLGRFFEGGKTPNRTKTAAGFLPNDAERPADPIKNEDLLSSDLYWRLDHSGQPLNRDFKSKHQNDDNYESGLSVWGSLPELLSNFSGGSADYARGNVDVVAMRGKRVGTGQDGEPVVVPISEAARFNHPNLDNYTGSPTAREMTHSAEDIDNINDFLDMGWKRVPELNVENSFMPRDFEQDETGRMAPKPFSEKEAKAIISNSNLLTPAGSGTDERMGELASEAQDASKWRTMDAGGIKAKQLAIARTRDRETNALTELQSMTQQRERAEKAVGIEEEPGLRDYIAKVRAANGFLPTEGDAKSATGFLPTEDEAEGRGRGQKAAAFVRFGNIPEGGISHNHVTGELEKGTSVYRAERTEDGLKLLPQNNQELGTLAGGLGSRPAFVVQGNHIGAGSDGEPLLANAKAKPFYGSIDTPLGKWDFTKGFKSKPDAQKIVDAYTTKRPPGVRTIVRNGIGDTGPDSFPVEINSSPEVQKAGDGQWVVKVGLRSGVLNPSVWTAEIRSEQDARDVMPEIFGTPDSRASFLPTDDKSAEEPTSGPAGAQPSGLPPSNLSGAGVGASKEDSGAPEDGNSPSERLTREAEAAGVSMSLETLKALMRGDFKAMARVRQQIREKTGSEPRFLPVTPSESVAPTTRKPFIPPSGMSTQDRAKRRLQAA